MSIEHRFTFIDVQTPAFALVLFTIRTNVWFVCWRCWFFCVGSFSSFSSPSIAHCLASPCVVFLSIVLYSLSFHMDQFLFLLNVFFFLHLFRCLSDPNGYIYTPYYVWLPFISVSHFATCVFFCCCCCLLPIPTTFFI